MASFRNGFKIFGEISVKRGLGRIRSFSEDRKPDQWLPEDQWAVRQPGSTCSDICGKPKKPPKPSRSWLSICRDPPKEIPCDVRHSNCPPPPAPPDAPWYSLENFIKKKPQEKTPSLSSCKEERKRRELTGEDDEVCENIQDKEFPLHLESSECCTPSKEPSPAPVVNLTCPLPKELDIMLWCNRPCTDTSRVPTPCLSDRLPYDEFRPQKIWKPPPFSLPCKSDSPEYFCGYRSDAVAFSEFKNVEVPRPLYTRYKSVELSSTNFCMTDVQCEEDKAKDLAITPLPPPPPPPCPSKVCLKELPPESGKEKLTCPEKPLLAAASCTPVRIKKAPKYTFQPKISKLIERRVKHNPCPQFDLLNNREKTEEKSTKSTTDESTKVITGTLTDEPQTYEREIPLVCSPPSWMYAICKPGAQETPLVPCKKEAPSEPDRAEETDGLKFYDGKNGNICPLPNPDPCIEREKKKKKPPPLPPPPPPPTFTPPPQKQFRNRFVLMPSEYNIKFTQRPESETIPSQSSTFEKFLELKTQSTQKCSKSYPQMKENILYDLQRLCPNPPVDPSKLNAPSLKPPQPECPQPPSFYRSYSTFRPSGLVKWSNLELFKTQRRSECEDTSGKCKARPLIPKPRPCPEVKPPSDCSEITLPCCPKARIPPNCDVKRPPKCCKKKLPPKPSFSECSKDPLPCPRITECDCWEKKVGGKNKK